ncbi:MAG: TetR family transcriptional regulator [Planctomycetota bacterium]|jgi:AcrR family transcriptional regulator
MARTSAEESEQMHAAIVEAAVKLLAEKGVAGLRVPEVARAVGRTQGAVYGRFPDKEALCLEALRAAREDFLGPVVFRALRAREEPIDALENVSQELAALGSEHPHAQRMIARLAAELGGERGPLTREIRQLFFTFSDLLETLLTEAQERGRVRTDVDPTTLSLALVGAHLGLALFEPLVADRTSFGAMAEALTAVVTPGVSAAGPPAPATLEPLETDS